MNEIQGFFRGVLTDFLTATDTNNTASKTEKNEVIKSVALRVLGALVLLTSGASFVMAGISFLTLSPITAIAWSIIGLFALASGHSLIQVGINVRERIEILAIDEFGHDSISVDSGEGRVLRDLDVLKGAVFFQIISRVFSQTKQYFDNATTA